MKTWLISAGIGLVALHLFADPFSDLTFDAALQKAAQTHKIVLVDFYTTWCGPCKLLDKNTWTDADVIKLLQQQTVPLRLDAEKETNLASRFQIEAYPTVLLVKPDGTELDRLVGYREPKTFMADFQAALSGKDSIARAKEKLTTGGTNDPMLRMQYARSLAEKGKNAEALDEYLWCFDHGNEASPAFAGVRLSFLLSDIKTLAVHYPAAGQALESRRDAQQAKVLAGTTDRQTVLGLVRLNSALGQDEKNLAVFDQLPAGSPARDVIAGLITDQLLAARRYRDILNGQDGKAVFAQRVDTFNLVQGSLNGNPAKDTLEKSLRQSTIAIGAHYFEALAGMKRDAEGKELAQQILKFDASAATHTTLAAAAERAGNAGLAQYVKQ